MSNLKEKRKYLSDRYEEQSLKFPRLREIPKAEYIKTNLRHMKDFDRWPCNKKDGEA